MAIGLIIVNMRFARRTAPLAGLVGLLLMGVGLKFENYRLITFGGGLLLFTMIGCFLSEALFDS